LVPADLGSEIGRARQHCAGATSASPAGLRAEVLGDTHQLTPEALDLVGQLGVSAHRPVGEQRSTGQWRQIDRRGGQGAHTADQRWERLPPTTGAALFCNRLSGEAFELSFGEALLQGQLGEPLALVGIA
jgi:hypothetical protein